VRLAVLALIIVAAAPADAGPRKGKIVRVERPRSGARGTPRICQLREGDGIGMCWGRPPQVGEAAVVVDPDRNRGQIRVTEVTPSDEGCQLPQSWTFKFDRLDADLQNVEPWKTWALIDVDLGPNAHVIDSQEIKAPDDPNATAWLAVGRGHAADDGAEFMVVAYQCDENGQKQVTGAYTGYCLDYWTQAGGRWTQMRRDIVANCRN